MLSVEFGPPNQGRNPAIGVKTLKWPCQVVWAWPKNAIPETLESSMVLASEPSGLKKVPGRFGLWQSVTKNDVFCHLFQGNSSLHRSDNHNVILPASSLFLFIDCWSQGAKRPTPTQSTCLYYDHDNEASKCVLICVGISPRKQSAKLALSCRKTEARGCLLPESHFHF